MKNTTSKQLTRSSSKKPTESPTELTEAEQPSPNLQAAFNALHLTAADASNPKEWASLLDRPSQPLDTMLQKAFGVTGASFAHLMLADGIASTSELRGKSDRGTVNTSVQAIVNLAPKGAMQALLASQMTSIHLTAMAALHNSAHTKDPNHQDRYINQAAKLMRLFCQQTELLARLQRKISQQRVIVERVDVNQGGQAIVGAVSKGGVGVNDED